MLLHAIVSRLAPSHPLSQTKFKPYREPRHILFIQTTFRQSSDGNRARAFDVNGVSLEDIDTARGKHLIQPVITRRRADWTRDHENAWKADPNFVRLIPVIGFVTGTANKLLLSSSIHMLQLKKSVLEIFQERAPLRSHDEILHNMLSIINNGILLVRNNGRVMFGMYALDGGEWNLGLHSVEFILEKFGIDMRWAAELFTQVPLLCP